MMKLVRRVLGIYSGEATHASRFARMALFWAFGSSCLDTLSDGLFLERIGAPHLPYVYLWAALGMISISTLVLYSLRVVSPYRILTLAMGIGVCVCFIASIFLTGDPPPAFWYALKIAARITYTVLIACSWTFIDQYHDLQDAKRVYALYSAAYFTGTILAGTAINLFLDRIGFAGLLLAAATSLFGALLEARGIGLKAKPVHDDTVEGVFSGSRNSFFSMIRLVFQSRFALLLLSLSLILQLLITVTEFNYMDSFGKTFHAEGEIAEFLGKCRALISFGNILFGVFFYGRFVRRLGIAKVLLITPLFFLGVYTAWVSQDAIALAVLGLIAVDGVLFTIEDNCFNLLSNAVPAQLKSRVRILNDSFFEPTGMLLSACLLFAIQQGSHWLGLGLSIGALLLAFGVRSTYAHAIFITLKENALHFDQTVRGWLSGSRKEKKGLLEALQSPSDETRLLAIEALLELGENSTQIIPAISRLGAAAKIQLLRLLDTSPFGADSQLIPLIASWAYPGASLELSKWAHFYLAKRGQHQSEGCQQDLEETDLLRRGAAAMTLKSQAKIEQMLQSSHIDEIGMGLDLLEDPEQVTPFLAHGSLFVKRAAARSMAKWARSSHLAPRLIEELSQVKDNTFRLSLLDALRKIGDLATVRDLLLTSAHFRPNERRKTEKVILEMGDDVIPILLASTRDIALPEKARILASKVLGQLALPELQKTLIDILDIEIERAYFYFYFGHTIQSQYPLYDLEMLQTALLTGYQSVIDFIIHLLGAAGSLEEADLLVRALHSRNAKVQAHAIESLERTCQPRIFRLIAPLVDDLPLEEKMSACLAWQGDYPKLTLSELLAKLERSPSLFDKVVAAQLKAKLQMPNWKEELREQMKESNNPFHQFAHELLDEKLN